MKLAAEQAECTAPHGLHRSTRCKIIGLPSIRLTSCRATLQRGAVTARKAYMTPQSQFRYETGNAPADSACRLLVLMDHSLDFIELVSRRGVIEGVSGAIASLAGYEPKEIIGQHFHDLIHHADRAAADGAIAAVVALGRDEVADHLATLGIDGGRRFIQDQDPGPPEQRERQQRALLFAAAESSPRRTGAALQVEQFE